MLPRGVSERFTMNERTTLVPLSKSLSAEVSGARNDWIPRSMNNARFGGCVGTIAKYLERR